MPKIKKVQKNKICQNCKKLCLHVRLYWAHDLCVNDKKKASKTSRAPKPQNLADFHHRPRKSFNHDKNEQDLFD